MARPPEAESYIDFTRPIESTYKLDQPGLEALGESCACYAAQRDPELAAIVSQFLISEKAPKALCLPAPNLPGGLTMEFGQSNAIQAAAVDGIRSPAYSDGTE